MLPNESEFRKKNWYVCSMRVNVIQWLSLYCGTNLYFYKDFDESAV